jgi:hypothetical protein
VSQPRRNQLPTEPFVVNYEKLYDTNDLCSLLHISRNTLWGDGSPERPGWIKLGYWPEPDYTNGPHANSKAMWLPATVERGVMELPSKFPWKTRMPANDDTQQAIPEQKHKLIEYHPR